jgi:hypothetical protein
MGQFRYRQALGSCYGTIALPTPATTFTLRIRTDTRLEPMRDYVNEFPHLSHLIGGYFHQDWKTDGDTWEDVVKFFCRMEQPQHRRGVVEDIEELLRLSETELQLLQALNAFGCAYRNQGSIREWLRAIVDIARSSLDRVNHQAPLQ